MEIIFSDYKGFVVTGVDTSGKRFKSSHSSNTQGAMTAFSTNLWQGSVWGILKDGKRKLLKRVYN